MTHRCRRIPVGGSKAGQTALDAPDRVQSVETVSSASTSTFRLIFNSCVSFRVCYSSDRRRWLPSPRSGRSLGHTDNHRRLFLGWIIPSYRRWWRQFVVWCSRWGFVVGVGGAGGGAVGKVEEFGRGCWEGWFWTSGWSELHRFVESLTTAYFQTNRPLEHQHQKTVSRPLSNRSIQPRPRLRLRSLHRTQSTPASLWATWIPSSAPLPKTCLGESHCRRV